MSMNSQRQDILSLLTQLVACESITPHDGQCQQNMKSVLSSLGFRCQSYDNPPVSNFYAEFGSGKPLIIFAGHTDVVPIGDQSKWHTHPFQLQQQDDLLFGRGVADMKGSLASMLVAMRRFVTDYPNPQGTIGFLITSAEEGDEFALGTPYVMNELKKRNIYPDYCIVGEPSSSQTIGDAIKVGRRGSLTGKCIIQGKQGHVAYPQLAENAIHIAIPALQNLINTVWDSGNAHFPPTSLQITHIQAGGQANNIIPGDMHLHFNFRYSTEQTAEGLKNAVQVCFDHHKLRADIEWILSGEPFLTSQGRLLDTCVEVIQQLTDKKPELSTSGGTSDGRFIAPYGVEVIELGPVNATIHQVNECVSLSDLDKLCDMYYAICQRLLG